MIRRYRAAANGEALEGAAVESDWFSKEVPAIHEWLTHTKYDDGSPRAPGSVTLFLGDTGPQGCVTDKDAGVIAFVSGASFGAVLEALESGLAEDRLDWRRSKPRKK